MAKREAAIPTNIIKEATHMMKLWTMVKPERIKGCFFFINLRSIKTTRRYPKLKMRGSGGRDRGISCGT